MKNIFISLIMIIISTTSAYSQMVFICTGEYAEVYHSNKNCRGLNNCKSDIDEVNKSYAINYKSRRPCCICWKTDSPCSTDEISSNFRPLIPRFSEFYPSGNARLAQVEVGMYLQNKYDTRKDWIQNRINGLVYLLNTLFVKEKTNCDNCDFDTAKNDFRNKISKIAQSNARTDFAKDYSFNIIVKDFNTVELEIFYLYNLILHK
jgi:hypothetical protein